MFCQRCGGYTEYLLSGSCGGYGGLHGCPKCNIVYQQVTGGIVPTPGGEQYSVVEFSSYEDIKLQVLEEECKPYKLSIGEKKGSWVWYEGYYGESHVYSEDQEEQAKLDHKAFVQAFEDSISAPVHCNRKALSIRVGEFYRCRVCNKILGL